MNEFKESLKVERENGGEIVITEPLRNMLIELMKGNLSKKEVMSITGIGDKHTIEIKIGEMVAADPNLKLLYDEYMNRKSMNFNGYNFRAEAIDMLRKDYSQSIMARKIGINRRSYSTKVKKLQQENADNILGILLQKHAMRKMRRQAISPEELIKINLELDEYEKEFPVGNTKYETKNPQEVRMEKITKVLELIETLKGEGFTIKDLSRKGIISETSYRKYRAEAENINCILNKK